MDNGRNYAGVGLVFGAAVLGGVGAILLAITGQALWLALAGAGAGIGLVLGAGMGRAARA